MIVYFLQTSECSGLQHTVDDLKRRLEMAELYNQQLSNQNEAGTETLKVVQQLQQERDDLTTQLQQVGSNRLREYDSCMILSIKYADESAARIHVMINIEFVVI